MASILDASLSSDSEDDVDYVPPGGNDVGSDSSCDEYGNDGESDDNIELGSGVGKGKKTKQRRTVTKEPELEETSKAVPAVDEKQRAQDLWASFLSDVESVSPKNPSPVVAKSTTKPEIKSEAKSSEAKNPEIPKIFEFAGETFSVDKDTKSKERAVADVKDTETAPSQDPTVMPKKRGIGSVLGTIMNKKQKLNVLEKTLIDWKSFKQNEGIEEDLEKFNKGKQGYIERQRFLERSDLRSFEKEKNMRQTLRKK